MAPSSTYSDLLIELTREAKRIAGQRGHRLSPFTAARHDPLRYVSFCTACGGLVIIDAAPRESVAPDAAIQRMQGYALEASCAGRRKSTAAPGVLRY